MPSWNGRRSVEVDGKELVEVGVGAPGLLVAVDADETRDAVAVEPKPRGAPAARIECDRLGSERLVEQALLDEDMVGLHGRHLPETTGRRLDASLPAECTST